MKVVKWVLRIVGFLAGIALLGFFVWLGFRIGEMFGLIKI